MLVQSREDEQVLPRVRICTRHKLRYIGNGVVLDRFGEAVAASAVQLFELPVVMMVSRLVKEKGCVGLLGAGASALQDRASFVHVGPTESDQRDAISAEEISSAPRVRRLSWARWTTSGLYLAAADIVVLPSYREGIPRWRWRRRQPDARSSRTTCGA